MDEFYFQKLFWKLFCKCKQYILNKTKRVCKKSKFTEQPKMGKASLQNSQRWEKQLRSGILQSSIAKVLEHGPRE